MERGLIGLPRKAVLVEGSEHPNQGEEGVRRCPGLGEQNGNTGVQEVCGGVFWGQHKVYIPKRDEGREGARP